MSKGPKGSSGNTGSGYCVLPMWLEAGRYVVGARLKRQCVPLDLDFTPRVTVNC